MPYLLPSLLLLPLLGALPIFFIPKDRPNSVKTWTLAVSLAVFIASLPLWLYDETLVDGTQNLFQFNYSIAWLSSLNINLSFGADGLSVLLILLTTLTTPLAVLGAWNYIDKREKEFYIALLVLETFMIGVFAVKDLVLFYLFFEAGLIPMYLIIGIWGGAERLYATIKFVLYTAFGSLLMLAAIFYLTVTASQAAGPGDPVYTFDMVELAQRLEYLRTIKQFGFTTSVETWLFLAFALAFAIKVPMFPFHTWLPDAHVQAPTPGSVVLAAVLLKMGTYGFLRLAGPFFPEVAQAAVPWLAVLCLIGIVYGSLMAYVQFDLKKLIAYSSVAHMGTCMLGIFSGTEAGIQGGIYIMLSHGLSTGALFLLAGMLYERTHTRAIEDYGGLGKVVPKLTVCFVIATLGSIGLPLTSGFVGEFLALLGAFQANPIWGLIGVSGVILGAVYMLSAVRRTFFGPITRDANKSMQDLNGREIAVLSPLLILIFVLGILPMPFFNKVQPSVDFYRKNITQTGGFSSISPNSNTAKNSIENQKSNKNTELVESTTSANNPGS